MVKQQSLGSNPLQLPLVRGRAKAAPPLTRGGREGFEFWGAYCFLLTPCLADAGLTWLKANGLQTSSGRINSVTYTTNRPTSSDIFE